MPFKRFTRSSSVHSSVHSYLCPSLLQPSPIAAALLTLAAGAHAQGLVAPQPLSQDDSALTLGTIHITSKASGPLSTRSVFSSVDIVGADMLENEHVDYSWELLSKAPGVQVTQFKQGTDAGRFSFRGFNGEGRINAVKLLIDGIPSNDNAGGMPFLDAVFPLDIQAIEIVRGTNDARYGLNNIAGNANVITRTGGNEGRASVTVGSFGTQELQVSKGIESGNWSQNYFLAWRDSDGYRDHADARKLSLSGKWFYTSDDGRWRTGVAIQHSNLFNRDHVATVAYTTSPDSPSGSKVDLYSLGYRLPLYDWGDSLDFIYGKSNVSSGQTLAVNSTLNITGRGEVYALRWNHYFARSGEWSSKLVFGADYKKIDSACAIKGGLLNGSTLNTCLPYSTLPLSLSYSAQRQSVGQIVDYNIGIARNMATGSAHYSDTIQGSDRYSLFTGGRQSMDNFIAIRGGASWFKGFESDWQMRLAATLQVSPHALPPVEQFGLAGANTVRGFTERAVAADSGVVVNAEVYTPELLSKADIKGNLRLLAFVDLGRGSNNNVTPAAQVPSTLNLASVGVGMRYALGRDLTLRLDVARVLANGNSVTENRGDLNAHLSAILGF